MKTIRRPLLFMRKRSLLGPFIGRHAGVQGLSRSVGQYIESVRPTVAIAGWTGLENCGS